MLKLDLTQRLDFDPTSVSEALTPGTQTDRYRLFEAVCEDDLGVVYRALDLKLQCQVAVKEHFPRLIASRAESGVIEPRSDVTAATLEAAVRDFAEDAKALRALQVRSIVRVLRVWLANGTAYRAMPWIEGATLASRLFAEKVRPGPPRTGSMIESIVGPLLQSVQAIHQRGRLHGRLSPSNVFVTTDSAIVLFGFRAKATPDQVPVPDAAALACRPIELVTMEFSAPNAVFDVGTPGPWSDIYSVGALMHLIVTGHLPKPADQRLPNDDYAPLGERIDPHHDAHLLLAIDWALKVLPDGRPRDVAQFRRRLQTEKPVAGQRARNLSTFGPAALDPLEAIHLQPVPDGPPVGKPPTKPVRSQSLVRQAPIDFASTRPMVYGDRGGLVPVAQPLEAAPAAVAQPVPAHDVEPVAEPAAEAVARPATPPARRPERSTGPSTRQDIPSARGPFDESAFNSKETPSAAPGVKAAAPPSPPVSRSRPKAITRRARRIITLSLLLCLVTMVGLTWWLLDPWLRPTLESSSLQIHRPTARPAPSTPPVEPASSGYSAPIDMGGSAASTAARSPTRDASSTATPAATSAPVPLAASKHVPPVSPLAPVASPAARRAPESARHDAAPSARKHIDDRCSDLLSKQSLGAAPPSSKPTDHGCP